MDNWAPVSINAVKGTPSTFTSIRFWFVRSVNGGFEEDEQNAALPPRAAWSSFPSGRVHNWSGKNSGELGAKANGGVEATVNERYHG